MARQSGILRVRGRIGNVVGMKNGFGTKSADFMREYVSDPNNPQTDFQMSQRAKMAPAVLFRRQLEKVISRAWEGTKYGGASSREFMKYALREPWENIPQIYKDSTLPIPGQYLISRGSLAPLSYSVSADGTTVTIEDLDLGDFSSNDRTIGNLSVIFNQAGFTQNGDQITLIKCEKQGTSGYRYLVESFFVDETDERYWGQVMTIIPISGTFENNSFTIPNGGKLFYGFAIVISREGTNTHQRSTQRFYVTKELFPGYFGTALQPDVADSYRAKKSASNLDWPYEDEEQSLPTEEDFLYTLSGLTGDRASLNGSQVRVRRNIDTQRLLGVYVTSIKVEESYGGSAPFVVDANDDALVYRDSELQSYYLSLTNVAALSALTQISVD